MRKKLFICSLLISATIASHAAEPLLSVINKSLNFSIKQDSLMAIALLDQQGKLPKTLDENGNLLTCTQTWWTAGFFPGSLWYLYDFSKDNQLKKYAEIFIKRVEKQQYNTNTHDVGFLINCSYGNAFYMTGDSVYKQALINAAKSLSTRYNPVVQCIRSWNGTRWQYPVIIDNMMNLELLFAASRLTGDSKYRDIAIAHANTTMKNHFRPDGSCFHVVSYDTITGKVVARQTAQGYSDSSSWARGQAWALYGYTMCYRETNDPNYLAQAEKIASFILNHKRLPNDKIPYWDFDAPNIPNALRDASAGTIICSALIELSQYVPKHQAQRYLQVAATQIRALSSPRYRAQLGGNGNFILMHSVGSLPANSEVNVPLSYADYYYIEALLRYRNLLLGKPLSKELSIK